MQMHHWWVPFRTTKTIDLRPLTYWCWLFCLRRWLMSEWIAEWRVVCCIRFFFPFTMCTCAQQWRALVRCQYCFCECIVCVCVYVMESQLLQWSRSYGKTRRWVGEGRSYPVTSVCWTDITQHREREGDRLEQRQTGLRARVWCQAKVTEKVREIIGVNVCVQERC